MIIISRPWDRQTFPEKGKPYGWIQWKGTNVCMDFHCECGHQGHIDDEFVYYVRCSVCNTVYMCSGFIEMVKLTDEEFKEEDNLVIKEAE